MSANPLSSFLFGNVDEEGNLDADNDLKITLQGADLDFLDKAISGSFGDVFLDKADEGGADQQSRIKPREDAQDFSLMDEVADDDDRSRHSPPPMQSTILDFSGTPAAEFRFTAIDSRVTAADTQSNIVMIPETLTQVFPSFKKDSRLSFIELFTPKIKQFVKPCHPVKSTAASKDTVYAFHADDRDVFYAPSNFVEIPDYLYERKRQEKRQQKQDKMPYNSSAAMDTQQDLLLDNEKIKLPVSLDPVMTFSWEESILWDSPQTPNTNKGSRKLFIRNEHVERVDWTKAIVWDEDTTYDGPLLKAEDPTILPPEIAMPQPELKPKMQLLAQISPTQILDKFNISDDINYEIYKNKSGRQKHTHGPIRLQHSLPAIKLMYPYFKYQMTIQELRSFHRPILRLEDNESITFSRVKNSKLKKREIRGKEPGEFMRGPKDLSLKENVKYVLFEYSEEHPPIMMNTGMASLIYNYYRKFDDKDTYVPQLPHGSAYVLDQVDASPFFGFGDVGKGQTINCLYNNIFRAPLFKHTPAETDFLVVRYRQTPRAPPMYFIRDIPFLYCVGQTFPAMEVPRPQSRRISAAMKARLQVAAFRLMRQDPLRRLRLEKLVKLFPEYSEGQIRQKVKDFCVFQRRGNTTGGYWKLKSGLSLPSEEELRKLLGPEMACLYESMLVGEQWLRDSGYAASLDYAAEDEDEDSVDIEVQLAPWTITHNFLQSSQGKCMLKLHGPGDPTGIGEGFSFIKTSMKEMFQRAGEQMDERQLLEAKRQYKYSIAEQQQAYKEEIDRIWNDQLKSLSATQEPYWESQMDQEDTQEKAVNGENGEQSTTLETNSSMQATASSMPSLFPSGNQSSDSDYDDVGSMTGSIASKMSYHKGSKVLVINRLIRNEQGEMIWKPEAISDAKVMTAYLKQRTIIEAEMNASIEKQGTGVGAGVGSERDFKKKSTQEHLQKYIKQKAKKDGGGQEKQSFTLTLKIPMQAGKTVQMMNEQVKRKREILYGDNPKKKKKKPLAELARIFDRVLDNMISKPESFAFCKPVNPAIVRDYYVIVKNPKTLEQIKEDIKAHNYLTLNALMADLQLVADNCKIYNGSQHPLTLIIKRLVDDARILLEGNMVDIKKLEYEITEFKKKKSSKKVSIGPNENIVIEEFNKLPSTSRLEDILNVD